MASTDDFSSEPFNAELFRRRARREGVSVRERVRFELISLSSRRVPLDSVIEFAERHNRQLREPMIDDRAHSIINYYELPAESWSRLYRRAVAKNEPMADYIRHELIALARSSTLQDVMLEFVEAQDANPDLNIDIEPILDATKYARALD